MKEHFRGQEELVNKIKDWKFRAARGDLVLTPFLNPHQVKILRSIIGNEFMVKTFSYIENSERTRAIVCFDYYQIEKNDYQLVLLKCNYRNDWFKIQHKDVMGAILNSGIKLDIMGEIVIFDDCFYIEVTSQMADFIKLHISTIGKAKILFEEVSEQITKEVKLKIEHLHLKSIRVDNVLANAFKLSRQEAKDNMAKGYANYDFSIAKDYSIIVSENKNISLKGSGRVKIIRISEKKNGNFLVTIGRCC